MLQKKKIFYLIYEIEYSDFLPRLLISLSLAKENNYVFMITFNKFKKIYNFLPKGVVLFHNLSVAKKKIYEKVLTKHKGSFFHEEPFQIYENYIDSSVIYEKDLLNKMEFVSCLSRFHKKKIDNYAEKKVKTIVHGFPKMDLSSKKYDYLFEENVKKIKEKYKNIIFIPSNFHFATYRLMNNDKYWYDKKINRFKNNKNKKELKKYIEQDIKINKHKNHVLKEYILAINNLSKIFPNYTFVIRPHPGDHPLFWQKMFNAKNIKVIFKYDVKTWIHSSILSLNHWCTSSIESYFQNKNAICYLPHFNKNLDTNFYSNIYDKAFNFKSLKNIIQKRLLKRKKFKKGLLKKYIKHTDNSSIDLIASDLNKIKISKNNLLYPRFLFFFLNLSTFFLNFLKTSDQKTKEKFKWPNKSFVFFKKILKTKKYSDQKIVKIGSEIYLIK